MSINETNYPHRPYRLNHVDIRSMQIFDPLVADSKTSIGTSFVQLHAAGGTLENGVRIKNTYANSRSIYVATSDENGVGTTGGDGFELGNREELFLEVRQLSHAYVKASGANGSVTFIAS